MLYSTIGLFSQRDHVARFALPAGQRKTMYFWGHKHLKRERFAQKLGLSLIRLEDGFLRSLGLGIDGWPPFSLVYDDVGIYYDTTRPSRLEQLILKCGRFSESFLTRVQQTMALICTHQLSKYNHAPDCALAKPVKPLVLVVDQTFGDMAVHYGGADARHFEQMLEAAVAENPQAEIWVKTHPDVISGKKRGYLTALAQRAQITCIAEDVNPLSLLQLADKVYCVTSQMGFEALMLNKPVVTFGLPWFAGWGLTDDRHPAVATLRKNLRRTDRTLSQLFACAYLQYSRYLNPYTGRLGTIFDVIRYLQQAKSINERLRGDLYCVGMSLWKRAVIQPFFHFPSCRLHCVRSLAQLEKQRLPAGSRLLVWGADKQEAETYAAAQHIPVLRIEDGFLRSVGLGSNLVAPLSLVIDDLGLYFDARQASRLEKLLVETRFSSQDKQAANRLQQQLLQAHIGKYNVGRSGWRLDSLGRNAILVPGQVEDDASIRFGSPEIVRNVDLLKKVRSENPQDFIVYKPHPDVLSGNRLGHIAKQEALRYADLIVKDVNMLDCILQVDEVHTMTSLAGFEALLRGKKVCCYGLPFYAGWGLTEDKIPLARRQRKLALWELVAGVLIYYPQYIHPQSRQMIDAEQAVAVLAAQKAEGQPSLSRNLLAKQWGKFRQLWRAFMFKSK